MEFRELLEIAKRKQLKHNEEVRKIKELHEMKAKQRKEELAKTRILAIGLNRNRKNGLVDESTHFTRASERDLLSTPIPDMNSCPLKKEPVCTSASTALYPVTEPSENSKAECHKISIKRSRKPTTVSKPSFEELLELAKRNVTPVNAKRQAFDDLLPCSSGSKYRELDSMPSVKFTGRLQTEIQNIGKNGLKIHPGRQKHKDSNDINQCSIAPDHPPALLERTNDHLTSNNAPKCAIAKQLMMGTQCIGISSDSSGSSKANSTPIRESQINRSRCLKSGNEERSSVSMRPAPAKPTVRSNLTTEEKLLVSEAKGNKTIPYKSKHTFSTVNTGRGIAAQLSVSGQLPVRPKYISSPEEDYESDDSFIDDSEAIESKDYARIVRDVHKALKYDPRKYKEVNPYDDLRSMEANYREIEVEEKRSLRIAAQEDAAELQRDLERKRRKRPHKNS